MNSNQQPEEEITIPAELKREADLDDSIMCEWPNNLKCRCHSCDFLDSVMAFGESIMQDGELPAGWESLGTEKVDALNRFGE